MVPGYKNKFTIILKMMLICAVFVVGVFTIIASTSSTYQPTNTSSYTTTTKSYKAEYQISLNKVERPEKEGNRYGHQKIYSVDPDKEMKTEKEYNFAFEDDIVKILWYIDSEKILFLLQNKTSHSIKIPWDEAAYVDETGHSHRVIHGGVKMIDRNNPQAPSVVVRKGLLQDIIYPTDHIRWSSALSGSWIEDPLFLSSEIVGRYYSGPYELFSDFKEAVNKYVGKQIQILLPLEIEDVIHDYIFTFTIDNVKTTVDYW